MITTATIGYPRIGTKRELKKALESFWKGDIKENELQSTAKDLRKKNWEIQKENGIDLITSNDFSFYDQVLDTICLLGAVPDRYNWQGDDVDLKTYFAMARGSQTKELDVSALEMTKWFDTNYHYLVPELKSDQKFKISSQKPFEEFKEAQSAGYKTKPVLLGPITFLLLSNMKILVSFVSIFISTTSAIKIFSKFVYTTFLEIINEFLRMEKSRYSPVI